MELVGVGCLLNFWGGGGWGVEGLGGWGVGGLGGWGVEGLGGWGVGGLGGWGVGGFCLLPVGEAEAGLE